MVITTTALKVKIDFKVNLNPSNQFKKPSNLIRISNSYSSTIGK